MKGTIIKRSRRSWTIILELGEETDPKTGKLKRKQKWIAVKGNKRDAEAKLHELAADFDKGNLVEPSKVTFGQWLDEWLESAIKPPNKRLRTYETYKSVINQHLKPSLLGRKRLQHLKPTTIKQYYNESKLSSSTLHQHQAIIYAALQAAQISNLIQRNVAKLVVGKPRKKEGNEDFEQNCWEPLEARRFLAAARIAGPQQAAFYTLALATGMRKAELCGLRWKDIDFELKRVTVAQQLIKPGPEPFFNPPKNKWTRNIDLSAEMLKLLLEHKKHQAEIKMANRTAYRDHGLAFAKEWSNVKRQTDHLGEPLQSNNIGEREFAHLVKAAGVKRITFHGLRHTCATLLLKAGVPVKVVSERLGHKKIQTTLDIYAHALPSMQKDAADTIASVLME